MLVLVRLGAQLVEERYCQLTQLADGRRAAIYRGLAYPLLDEGDAIDVSAEGFVLRPSAALPDPPVPPGAGVWLGMDGTYLLFTGDGLDCQAMVGCLRAGGVEVLRSGRYLGEPVDGLSADWFIRLAPGQADRVRNLLDSARLPDQGLRPEAPADIRLRLAELDLLALKARAERAERALAEARAMLDANARSEAEREALRAQVENERAQRIEAEREACEARQQVLAAATANPAASAPVKRPSTRQIGTRTAAMLSAFLPNIEFLRDSLDCFTVEFSDVQAVCRALLDLGQATRGMPPQWKALQGVPGWIEKSKIANGTDSQGRVYARLVDGPAGRWQVLISHKSEQSRDIEWLRRL
jgi:hypothetical protein